MTGSLLLFVMVIAFALPVFGVSGTGGPFSWQWLPSQGHFGILPMFAGSLMLSGLAVLVGWPLALGICCFELGVGSGWLVRLIHGLVRFMTAIPTVVYGFAAVFLLTPVIREVMGGTGLSWLTAALVLALLIVPTMVLVLEAGLRPQLEALCPESLALGFTRLELLIFLIFPVSRTHLVTALLLGFGRAVGDTLIALMLAGNASQVPHQLNESLRALTAHMALVTANEVGGAAYDSLFAAGMILLLVNALVSLILQRLAVPGETA